MARMWDKPKKTRIIPLQTTPSFHIISVIDNKKNESIYPETSQNRVKIRVRFPAEIKQTILTLVKHARRETSEFW